MPTWNFNLTGSDVELGRTILIAARADPHVIATHVHEDTGTLLRATLYTGGYPEPIDRNVWEFIRTRSDEYIIMEDDALNELRRAAGRYIPDGVNYSNPTDTVSFREQAQQAIEEFLRRSYGIPQTDLAQSMISPLVSRRFNPIIPIQPMLPGARPIYYDPLGDTTTMIMDSIGQIVIPEWCVPGTWVEEKRHRTAARIKVVDTTMFTVSLEVWKVIDPSMFYMMNITQLIEEWIPCEEPKVGRPWYERLDEDE